MDALVKLFTELESRWVDLRNKQDDEKFVDSEFDRLLKFTLQLQLDFRMACRPDLISADRRNVVKDDMFSVKLTSNRRRLVQMITEVDDWSSKFGQSLLQGKFIGHMSGKYLQMEKKVMMEDDFVINKRIDSLMHLLELTNSDEAATMIINVLETYRKALIRDTSFQNKITQNTAEKIQKSYMILLCHRKQYDHLYSLIKTFPHYRKIKYVQAKIDPQQNPSKGIKAKTYEIRIAAACLEELLKCEFEKGRLRQDIRLFHYYLYLLMELAMRADQAVRDDVERIILSASDMNVISDYYYLAATLLRLKMPNFNSNLVLKLISIGLSHDISYLEEIKYSTANKTIITSRGEVPREQEFILVHQRMFLALINLGYLVSFHHYPLARLCFHVASVCEPQSNKFEEILMKLPECDYNDYDETTMDPVLLNIRYQLETFHYDIKGKTRLTSTFNKVSNCSFESLEYINHRVELSDDLRPLEYPGVEKYLKKQNTEDSTHVSQVSDLQKCIKENEDFNEKLKCGFKNLRNLFVKKTQNFPSQRELFDIIKVPIMLNFSNVFLLTNTYEIYTNLVSMSYEDMQSSNFSYITALMEKRKDENFENLFFDWKYDDECGNGSDDKTFDLDEMYKSGNIKVLKLFRKGYCSLDVENILVFAIIEKKMKFTAAEFAYLNKNRNVELDPQPHNQIHAGFLYIINRRHPEFCRLSRLTSSLKKYYHVIEYYLDSYTFDGTPAKYKFILKYKTYKSKTDVGVNENSVDKNESIEVKQEILPPADASMIEPKQEKNKKLPMHRPRTQAIAKPKKEKIEKPKNTRSSVILLTHSDTFNLSPEIRDVFVKLQGEIAAMCGKDVKFNMGKLLDPESPHVIHPVTAEKSTITLDLKKIRNGNTDPREYRKDTEVNLTMNGKVQVFHEFKDEVVYDENNDNPRVASSSTARVGGSVTFEKLSHNVRFEIECIIDTNVSKLKCIFQGSRQRPKKKTPIVENGSSSSVQNNEPTIQISPAIPEILQSPPSIPTPVIKTEEIPMEIYPPETNFNPQPSNITNFISPIQMPSNFLPNQVTACPPQPDPYSNVVPNNDNYSNYNNMPQQNIYLPPFGSIAPTTSHLIQQEPIPQYTQPPVSFTTSTATDISYSEPAPPPVVHYNNNHQVFHQMVEQNIQPPETFHIEAPIKPKVEIQNIEIISPSKATPNHNSTINSEKKISFGKIPDFSSTLPQNGHSMKQEKSDLVDFEAELESMVKPALIAAPKYDVSRNIKQIPAVLKNENVPASSTNRQKNGHEIYPELLQPAAKPVSVIQKTPKPPIKPPQKHQEILQKSPPPLAHYANATGNNSSAPKSELRTPTKAEQKALPPEKYETDLIKKNGVKMLEAETIDLTDDTCEQIDLTQNSIISEVQRKARKTKALDITFVSCQVKSEDYISEEVVTNRSRKRSLSPAEEDKKAKVRLVDVLESFKDRREGELKKEMNIRLIPIITEDSAVEDLHCIAQPVTALSQEDPLLEHTKDLYDVNFTIVNFNSVSFFLNNFRPNSHGVGDKLTNLASSSNAKNTNVLREKLNNFSDVNRLVRALSIDLEKSSYSDRNRLNFSKNMKNYVKFNCRLSPKENNNFDDEKLCKKIIEKSHKHSLLYQMSQSLMNSLPGMNSFEFFAFPSRAQRHSLQIEVVHLKDLKTASSTSSSTSSTETSDLNDGTSNEPVNSSYNEIVSTNGSVSVGNSMVHVQKIGQTSISRENDPKTFQTSFGTIIKNTYPPATSRDVKSVKKEEKKVLITDGAKNNIKIIACTSQQPEQAPKTVNKNQTLINMLTQQVMMPTNSNRHYIITSKPTEGGGVKVENSNLMMTSSGQQILRKNLATGQSQLVQILNSPPPNFTMKSLNVITTTATATKPTNQVVTVTSSQSSTSTATPELPNSVKQQGIVQFICKTDGKIIHLTPICSNTGGGGVTKKITYKVDTSGARGPTILHHANQQIILNNQLHKGENPNILTIIQKQAGDEKKGGKTLMATSTSSSIGTRSIYEENYAKFIQTPSGTASASDLGLLTISSTPASAASPSGTFIQKIGKTVIQSSGQILPKFNQAFGKSIFSSSITSTSSSEQHQIKKVVTSTRSIVNAISPTIVSKITKNEVKTEAPSTSIFNIVDSESVEKQSSLPTLQSALQGNSLLYARPIGNGKLIASGNNNNVLLTALRNNNSNQATGNLRIITTMSETQNANRQATLMTPVRISVPIQIPQLINSVRPQAPGNFRQQIVIATPTVKQQNSSHQMTSSKLETLLLSPSQSQVQSQLQSQNTTITIPKQEIDVDKIKIEQKSHASVQRKNVDNSTLEQLREFDMVLEQVLERSSATPNSVSSPPRPDSANRTSPRKQCSDKKNECKSSSVSVASISPNDSPTSSKSLSGVSNCSKNPPKLQEDEHTAQRILDILANYKEQVRNSPDLNNKPAPRRRANPPTNPPASKRKKVVSSTGSIKNSKQFGSSSDVMTDTMGSEEDSSCGMGSGVASTGSINNSPRGDIDEHTDVSMDNNFYGEDLKRENAQSPQSSSSSVATSPAHNKFSLSRRLLMTASSAASSSSFEPNKSTTVEAKSNIFIGSPSSTASSITRSSSSSINESIERLSAQGSTTAVLMPGNYILPMNVLKSGQQLAILSSNSGQKIIAVPTNQLTSSHHAANSAGGTSIILQRYVNQISEGGASSTDKAILTHSSNELESSDNQLKSFRLHASPNTAVSLIANNKIASGSSPSSNQATTDAFYAAVKAAVEGDGESSTAAAVEIKHESDSNASFVNDKTLITEIIQQQQRLARNHPQQNFMIKLNEPSDSSSIMFVSNEDDKSAVKIKTEDMDFDHVVIKEEIVDLHSESDLLNSPMLNTKMEVDENTSSNHASEEKQMQQFQSILNSCLSKQPSSSKNATKNFLIDPSNKTLMCNDRKATAIDKEIFNPKSFSEECADLGVDEPIASDLFPEADLLFDSGSPKFDQINPHHDASSSQIKREIENGEVLLQMNYGHNITEPWLNFDTEDELVDDSQGESSDDVAATKSSIRANL